MNHRTASNPSSIRDVSQCNKLGRRDFHRRLAVAAAAMGLPAYSPDDVAAEEAASPPFKYILASCLYGYLYLGEILPEVKKVGATSIDIWPKPHGNQCEQLVDLGEEKFAELLERDGVSLGCVTHYGLGPFKLQSEMKRAKRFGCQTIVTGAAGPKGLAGPELKAAIVRFIEQLKPHLDVAAENDVTLAIENHGHSLIQSPDSLRWLAELRPHRHLGIALAPYHLPQDSQLIAGLIRDTAPAIEMFYAWQHGDGCMRKLPKEQELLQLPGRGPLDFRPIISALREAKYQRWTEVFMHPVPRGIPIMPTAAEVTQLVNESRRHLEAFVE